MRFENPYEILGLKPGASEEEVRQAYEKLLGDEEKKADAAAAYEQISAMKQETPAEEKTEHAEEAPAAEKPQAEKAEEAPAEEKKEEAAEASEKPAPEMEKGAKPGQIALGVLAIVVLAAVLVALIFAALGGKEAPSQEGAAASEPVAAETAAPVETEAPTVPADGDPNDETCKGSYTASDEEVKAAADTVVASMEDYQLTNAQLQIYYWMGIQSYVQSSGPYLQFMGLDLNKPLDTQVCPLAENRTWQQFFLEQALTSWQSYQGMAAEAEKAGHDLDQELKDALKTLPEDMETDARNNGFESAEALLANNVGVGASIQDYVKFMEVYHRGFGYFDAVLKDANPTQEQMESYYQEHEAELTEGGITKDNKVASVRHILISPEDAESEDSWLEAEKKAKEILDTYLAGDKTSESFAKLATEHTMDPGSQATGGLYEDFPQGQMVPQFDQWSFDEARKNGDTDIVKTDYGYHIMYFVSTRPVWQDQVSQVILKEVADRFIDECSSKYPVDIDYSAVVLGELKAQ